MNKFEQRLARRIGGYIRKHGRTPKKWEIIRRDPVNDPGISYSKPRGGFVALYSITALPIAARSRLSLPAVT